MTDQRRPSNQYARAAPSTGTGPPAPPSCLCGRQSEQSHVIALLATRPLQTTPATPQNIRARSASLAATAALSWAASSWAAFVCGYSGATAITSVNQPRARHAGYGKTWSHSPYLSLCCGCALLRRDGRAGRAWHVTDNGHQTGHGRRVVKIPHKCGTFPTSFNPSRSSSPVQRHRTFQCRHQRRIGFLHLRQGVTALLQQHRGGV